MRVWSVHNFFNMSNRLHWYGVSTKNLTRTDGHPEHKPEEAPKKVGILLDEEIQQELGKAGPDLKKKRDLVREKLTALQKDTSLTERIRKRKYDFSDSDDESENGLCFLVILTDSDVSTLEPPTKLPRREAAKDAVQIKDLKELALERQSVEQKIQELLCRKEMLQVREKQLKKGKVELLLNGSLYYSWVNYF